MARKPSSGTRVAAKGAHQPAPFELFYPVLAQCTLDRSERPDGSGDAEIERFYDAVMRPIDFSKRTDDIAICEFSAGQKVNGTKILEIQATYFVGFQMSDSVPGEARAALVEQIVGAAAWPMFRDLFIHIGSQSGEELPLLPNVPKLRWQAPDEPGD